MLHLWYDCVGDIVCVHLLKQCICLLADCGLCSQRPYLKNWRSVFLIISVYPLLFSEWVSQSVSVFRRCVAKLTHSEWSHLVLQGLSHCPYGRASQIGHRQSTPAVWLHTWLQMITAYVSENHRWRKKDLTNHTWPGSPLHFMCHVIDYKLLMKFGIAKNVTVS